MATDAEEILRIGDWGANGMDISIGKLAVYTAAPGINPDRVIPVMLDVGTDRESLLNDPLYVGNRHSRVRGGRYDALVKAYIETISAWFPRMARSACWRWSRRSIPRSSSGPRPRPARSPSTPQERKANWI